MAKVIPETEAVPSDIQKETQTFRENHTAIMRNEGKFVLIQGRQVVGYYGSYDTAANKGYELFGLQTFMVKQVQVNETPLRAMRCGVVKTDGKLRVARARAR